jgi:hypothetical protein
MFSYGIFSDVENELVVTETDPASLGVKIDTGWAFVHGFWYHNDSALTKSLGAADPALDRIDRIILRLDSTINFKISCEVKAGTPAASPSPPSLTQTDATYEISLAQVLVEAGVTSISNVKITDEREFVAVQNNEILNIITAKGDLIVGTGDGIADNLAVGSNGKILKAASGEDTGIKWDDLVTETTTASSATPTPVRTGQRSFYSITALAEAATFAAPSGTPVNGDMLLIRIKDNGTARALTWNAIYDGLDDTLPSTTTLGKVMYILFIYNSASSKWEMLSVKVDA